VITVTFPTWSIQLTVNSKLVYLPDDEMNEDEEKVLEQMILAVKSRPGKKDKSNLPLFKEEGLNRQKKLGKLRDKKEKKKGGKKPENETKKENVDVTNGKKKENVEKGKKKRAVPNKGNKKEVPATGDNYDFNDF
jgi:hypothetical protein